MRNRWKSGRTEQMKEDKTERLFPAVILNLSGIYKEEKFWLQGNGNSERCEQISEISWVDAQDISGTNCYCDEEAAAEINRRTENVPVAGIHFIDSGNYHYITRLWIGRIREPFRLLVFDNHTDMQLPAFGGLLSCGGWIAAALEELEKLCQVILVGPDEEACSQVEDRLKEKVVFLSREHLASLKKEEILQELKGILAGNDLPLYLSIDKDVLGTEDAQTTWSQGDMSLQTLAGCVKQTLECAEQVPFKIAGVDICGECDRESAHDSTSNDKANRELLELFLPIRGK